MNLTYQNPTTTWLRTQYPVRPVNASLWMHLHKVQTALREGVAAAISGQRPEFYEIELQGVWYYIHVPRRMKRAYLVAAGERSIADRHALALVAHGRAC